jgi:hypothetical protein
VKFDKSFLFYFVYCDTKPSIFWVPWEKQFKVTPGFEKKKAHLCVGISLFEMPTGCLYKVLSISSVEFFTLFEMFL